MKIKGNIADKVFLILAILLLLAAFGGFRTNVAMASIHAVTGILILPSIWRKASVRKSAGLRIIVIISGLYLSGMVNRHREPAAVTSKDSAASPDTGEVLKGQLYRNNKYKFRISFPEGWTIGNGSSKSTVKLAEKGKIAQIAINVKPNTSAFNFNTMSDDKVTELVEGIVNSFTEQDRFPGRVVETGVKHIFNQKMGFTKLTTTVRLLDKTQYITTNVYITARGNWLYILIGKVRSDYYEKHKNEIVNSLNTFFIEDF